MTRPGTLALAFLAALALASPAAAEQYDVSGEHSRRGPFTGWLKLDRRPNGDLMVVLAMGRAGEEPVVSAGPVLERLGGRMRARLVSPVGGLAAAVAGAPRTESRVSLELTGAGAGVRFLVTDPEGEAQGAGTRVAVAPAPVEPAPHGLVGRLKALASKEVKKALEGGVGLDERFSLTDFLHVGVGGEVTLLREGELSVEQKRALEGRGERWAWLATEVEGGLRLPFSAAIPIGAGGTVQVGLEAGAALRYEVVDLYQRPDGVKDWKAVVKGLREMGEKVYTLPLTADEALAHPLGAERSLEGHLTVAVSGSLGVGYDTKVLGDLVEVGASAHVGGFYRFRQHLRLELTRLGGSSVRVRLDRGRRHAVGATARALLGATLDEGAVVDEVGELTSIEYLEPVTDAAVGGVADALRPFLRFELKADASAERASAVDISYRFDLRQPRAREAYERAVRGDLTAAAAASEAPGAGVELEFRIFDHERRTYAATELHVSELLEASTKRAVTAKELLVRDRAGETLYDVIRVQRERKLGGLVALFTGGKTKETMTFELVRGDRLDDDSTRLNRSLRYRLERSDGATRLGEVEALRRILGSWGLEGLDEASLATPERRFLRSRYGATTTRIAVDLSERGVAAVLGRSEDDLRRAYLEAWAIVEDEQPGKGAREDAERFAKDVAAIAAEAEGDVRARRLGDLVRRAGWDPTPISALVRLCPRENLRIQAAIAGDRIDYDAERRGRWFDSRLADLHGH